MFWNKSFKPLPSWWTLFIQVEWISLLKQTWCLHNHFKFQWWNVVENAQIGTWTIRPSQLYTKVFYRQLTKIIYFTVIDTCNYDYLFCCIFSVDESHWMLYVILTWGLTSGCVLTNWVECDKWKSIFMEIFSGQAHQILCNMVKW